MSVLTKLVLVMLVGMVVYSIAVTYAYGLLKGKDQAFSSMSRQVEGGTLDLN